MARLDVIGTDNMLTFGDGIEEGRNSLDRGWFHFGVGHYFGH